jgi:hypothetical protein
MSSSSLTMNQAIRIIGSQLSNRNLLIASQESQRMRNLLEPILIKRLQSRRISNLNSPRSNTSSKKRSRFRRVIGQPGVYRDRVTRKLYTYNNRTGTLRMYTRRKASSSSSKRSNSLFR